MWETSVLWCWWSAFAFFRCFLEVPEDKSLRPGMLGQCLGGAYDFCMRSVFVVTSKHSEFPSVSNVFLRE
jgi:hypothetical protein